MLHRKSEKENVSPCDDKPQMLTAGALRPVEPQRKLVSKGVYVRTVGKKIGLFSFSGMLLCLGLFLTLCTLISLYLALAPLIVFFGITAGFAFWHTGRSFIRAGKIERVQPITNRTSHLLPPEESLVRASSMPSNSLSSELLRAARTDPTTPADELLRPTVRRP